RLRIVGKYRRGAAARRMDRPRSKYSLPCQGASHPRWLEHKHEPAPTPIVSLFQRASQTVGFKQLARSAKGLSKCAKKLRALYGHGPGRNPERRCCCRGELLSARRALFEIEVCGCRNGAARN